MTEERWGKEEATDRLQSAWVCCFGGPMTREYLQTLLDGALDWACAIERQMQQFSDDAEGGTT
jgi:hypothetical protein